MSLEDDLLALERRVLVDAAGDFFTAVQELRRMLAAGLPGIQAKLVALAIPNLEAAARAGVIEAFTLGGATTVESVEVAAVVPANTVSDARMRLDQGVPGDLTDPLVGLDAFLIEQKRKALALISAGMPVEEALGPIFQAENTAQRRVVTGINESGNRAALTVGEAVRQPMVWVNERDACVYCLALAGHVIERAGDDFPKADRFADGSTGQATVQQPPLHPHCRCTIEVLVDDSYAVALKREAERSILRGFSLQSESNAVRIRAAEKLLADPNLVAPKSVKEYARRAVKAKQFPRGRAVADGGPRLVVT